MTLYMSFMGFEKIQVFVQNTYVLAYDFAENRQFGTKKMSETPYFFVVTLIFRIGYT
jgi:hypothetical protein